MKKTAVLLVMLFYGFATMGATIQLHYCMNDYVEWTVSCKEKNKKCGKCGMKEKNDGCCKTEHSSFKVKDTHIAASEISYHPKFVTETIIDYASFQIEEFKKQEQFFNLRPHAPPLTGGIPLFITHCVFRI